MADTKSFTIYLDAGSYVTIEAEELKIEPGTTQMGQSMTVVRLKNGQRVVAQFSGGHVIGWTEGDYPLKRT